jgi:isopenicillin-N N-acyltransferase-like protein
MARAFLPVITLRGGPYERGYQHGERARDQVGVAVDTYLRAFQRDAGLDREQVRRAAAQFIPGIERFDPELLTELRGVAEGAGQRFEDIVAVNARNELLFAVQPECTAFAVLPQASRSGHAFLGQNLDWKASATASAVVLEILQEDQGKPNIVTVTEAGTLGRSGMNAAGLGLCVNFLRSSGSDARRLGSVGVPTQLVRRAMLNAWTFADAASALDGLPRCIASNYLLAHADGEALDFETAPEGIGRLEPANGLLTHSNHFITPWGRPLDTGTAVFPDTIDRLARIELLLRPHVGKIDVDHLFAALRDHSGLPDSICRHGDERDPAPTRLETSVSIVMDLTDRKIWMTAGPPCESEYTVLEFNSLRSGSRTPVDGLATNAS